MTDRCPHLDYREAADGSEFETPRAYCTVVERFVQPMRADICNARGELAPADHCEFYREHEGVEDPWLVDSPLGESGSGADGEGDGSADGEGDGSADGEGDGSAGDP